ncbi:potassium channel protein [Verrucomicrobiota bacterium]|nr:potassium channel protein [Verrucomicrobiota bacterium]
MNPKKSTTRKAFQQLLPILVALVVMPAVGTLGYRLIEGWSFLDSLYMTIITLSTTGYGEVHPLSAAGRVFTMGLIVMGMLVLAYALSQAAEILFSGEWRVHWQNQRQTRMLKKLTGHVIVCGYGRVGRNVINDLLEEKLPFVVIDPNAEKIAAVQEAGYLCVQGDAAHESNLRAAGIERARGLVAAAKSDADNVFIVLTARSLRQDLSIVARADYEESEPKLRRAGANRVILPYHITGRRMVTMLLRPDVADFLDEVSHAGGLELVLDQVKIGARSVLAGKTIAAAREARQMDVTVLACKSASGQTNTRPGSDMVLEAESQLIVLGTIEEIQSLGRLARE